MTQFALLANDYIAPKSYKSNFFALQRTGTVITENMFWAAENSSPINSLPSWRSVYAAEAEQLLLYTPGSGGPVKFDRLASGWSEAAPLIAVNTDLPSAWADISDRRVAFSADGSTVYFSTSADLNLSTESLEGSDYSLYRFDLSDGMVSFVDSIGNIAAEPSCSADGEIFALQGTRWVLGGQVHYSSHSQILLLTRDLSGAYSYELVSRSSTGAAADADCTSPAISADGRFVTFASRASNLVAAASGGVEAQIYRYDTVTRQLELLSAAANGAPANRPCYQPAISANGRYVGFATAATNLTSYQGNYPQVLLADCGFYAAIADFNSGLGNISALDISGNFQPEATTVTLLQALTAGQLRTAAGQTVVVGQAYPVASFPWRYVASGTPGEVYLPLRVQENGPSVDLTPLVTVSQLQQQYVSLTDNGELAPAPDGTYEYGGLSCSEDGSRVSFFSTARLSNEDEDTGSWYDANVHL
ncbi:MAG: hypothetical protein GX564_04330, partial [Oligosphaeraceae bacterium]|nr:hypothetical protein [Oligosphaeraceae bacterium]